MLYSKIEMIIYIYYRILMKKWGFQLWNDNLSDSVLHAFWLKGGGGFAKGGGGGGGHFEVKEGHPDYLQITLFFLNAVLLLYLKLFYMFRDHNHVKMKFWDVKWLYLIM